MRREGKRSGVSDEPRTPRGGKRLHVARPPWQSSPGAAAKPRGERSVVRPGPGLGSSHTRSLSRSSSSSFRSGWTQGGLARAGFSPAGCGPRGPPPHSPRRGTARASSRRRERCGPRRAWWQTPWRPPRAWRELLAGPRASPPDTAPPPPWVRGADWERTPRSRPEAEGRSRARRTGGGGHRGLGSQLGPELGLGLGGGSRGLGAPGVAMATRPSPRSFWSPPRF